MNIRFYAIKCLVKTSVIYHLNFFNYVACPRLQHDQQLFCVSATAFNMRRPPHKLTSFTLACFEPNQLMMRGNIQYRLNILNLIHH